MTLVERYAHLGGMASGGMVLVLDDMVNGDEVTTTGIVRGHRAPREARPRGVAAARGPARGWDVWRKWARWGCHDFRAHGKPQPIVYAVAFDPDGWKRVSNDLIAEAGVNLRLLVVRRGDRRGRPNPGVIVETKAGRQALLGSVVIDATGDLDVAARAGTSRPRLVHRHPRVPAGRGRHRRRPPVRGGAPGGVRRAGPGGPPGPRQVVGPLVAQDAAARHRVVQLPAPDRRSMRSRSRT